MTVALHHTSRLLLAAAFAIAVAPEAFAQPESKAKAAAVEIDVQSEAEALEFAKTHHPELAGLLGPMKSARPKEYQKAIRELSRVSERIVRMQARFPERAAIELDLWKAESRLRLVAVKTAMGDDDERREQIEALVAQRNVLKLKLFEFERDEARTRIVELDQQIESLKNQEPAAVRKEVDRLVNSARSSARRVKTKVGPAAKRPAGSSVTPGAVEEFE